MQSVDISDWGDLRIFLAVVRGGSTLAASKALGVNQTTVSRRIDALEQSLGMALFDRDTRGFHPTAEGKALLDQSETVEQAVVSLTKHAQTISRSTTGVIRVTAASATFDVFIAPFINAHLAREPHVKIDYISSDGFLDLEAGEADIAFRATSRIDGDRLIVRRLPDFKWSVYCNRDYADNHGIPADAADLRNHKAIVFGGELENIIPQTWFARQIDPAKIVARCNSLTDIPHIPSKFVEFVPLSHRQGNCIPYAAIRWHDFGNRPALGRPLGHFSRHPDDTSPVAVDFIAAGLRRRSSIKLRIFRNRSLGTATSANWNASGHVGQPWPRFTSLSRNVVIDQCSTSAKPVSS